MSDAIFKLPLFAKVKQIKAMPCHGRGRSFGITDAIKPQPDQGLGYLVEVVAPRKVKILAWLAFGGAVFACEEPLSARPGRTAECSVARDADDGTPGFYINGEGRNVRAVRFSQRERDGRLTVVEAWKEMGPYGEGAYDLDEIGAACFLAQWAMPRERGEADPCAAPPADGRGETVGDVLDALMESPYPDALDALVYRGTREDATGFERYAARSLSEAGVGYVRPIAAAHDIDLRRLGSTGLFWTGCDKSELVDRELDTLQAVEGALNRLVFMEHYLGRDSSPRLADLTEPACEHAALGSLAWFPENIESLLRGSEQRSDYASISGTDAPRGGEWDVRTRFAATTERLRAPFSFDYDFDCDARGGVFSIEATVPAASAFPFDAAPAQNEARTAYALRLAMLLAAAAFGSSVGMVRTVVTMRERELAGVVVASIAFDRQLFAMELVPALKSGTVLDADTSVDDLIGQLSIRTLNMKAGADGELLEVEPIALDMPDRSAKMAGDARAIPAALVDPLRADTVADLDIFDTSDDPLRERYRELMGRVEEGGAGVASELMDLVAAYDAADALQGSDARPLYCVNMISRIIVGAHDEGPATRYRKVPDSAFDARATLCRLYREQGNLEDALRLGRELVELGPTSFSSYHSLALVYRELDRMQDAIGAIIEGLKVAAAPVDVACAYYRLGFWFWHSGNPSLGLACYALVPPSSYFFGEAQTEMQDLMREEHLSRRPSFDEARAALRAEGVPIAPVSALVEASAAAAIGLVDAGLFDAAGPIVHFLASTDVAPNSRDVLMAVLRSIS